MHRNDHHPVASPAMSYSAEDRTALQHVGGEDGPRHLQQQPYLPQTQVGQPRSPYYVSSTEFHRQQPRSPFVSDANPLQPKVRHTGTTPLQDIVGRVPRSSPLSVPTNTARNASSARSMQRDRNVSSSSGMGISRSPYTPASRFFVTVVPPADLASEASSSSSRNISFANASSHLRRGTLMPLYPTLGAQLYAISREYGLPSIGGLTLFLCDDGEGNLGPRIGEETWPYLWGRYFDDNSEDLYHDITSPTPPHSAMANVMPPYSAGQSFEEQRHHVERSSVDSQRLTGDGEGSDSYAASDSREQSGRRKQGSASLHGHVGGGSQSGISPRQLMTPSPFRTVRQDWRASPASSSVSMSRLPIVARIEWAVDTMRAPWWNQWINGGATASVQDSSRSAQVQQPERATNHNRRRSMQLPKMHNGSVARSYATTQPRSPTKSSTRDRQSVQERQGAEVLDDEEDDEDAIAQSGGNSTSGYARLRDDDAEDGEEESKVNSVVADLPVEEHHSVSREAARTAIEADDNLLSVDTAHDDGNSHSGGDTQSYAGFSALMGVVNSGGRWSAADGKSVRETRTSMQDGESVNGSPRSAFGGVVVQGEQSTKDAAEDAGEYETGDAPHHFDVGALEQTDEAMWQGMRGSGAMRAARPFDALSASTLSRQHEQGRSSAVNDWITRTYSPSDGQSALRDDANDEATSMPPVPYDTDGDHVSETHVPPEDDVAEVIGLWAEKTVEPNGVRVLDQVIVRDADAPGGEATLSKRISSSSVNSRGVHSRKQSSGDAASRRSSQRSSHRSSHRSSRHAGRASQEFKLLSAPMAAHMAADEGSLEPQSESSEMAANKLSLLSPIALQESAGTFDGPLPNVTGLLLPTNTPETRKRDDTQPAPHKELSVRIDASEHASAPHEQDGASLETPTILSPAMLSPRLLAPSVHSPGQMSGSSSSSDMSDALIDMERALALLSPAGFQSPSPFAERDNRAPESAFLGGGASGKRSRMVSNVSATESMARARHLSASVSPSLHWFRPAANDAAFPAVPHAASSPGFLAARQSVDLPTVSDDRNNSVKENLPPRPVSMTTITPTDEVDKGVPISAGAALGALSTNTVRDVAVAQAPLSAPLPTIQAHSADGTYRVDDASDTSGRGMIETTSYEDNLLEGFEVPAVPGTEIQSQDHHVAENRDYVDDTPTAELSIGPGIQDFDMLAQWVAAQQKQLPRSNSASPESEEPVVSERVNAGTQASEQEHEDMSHASPHIASTTARKETTYATVGVQAEIESSDRSSAQFSLVSDDATSEESEIVGNDMMEAETYDQDEDNGEEDEVRADSGAPIHSEATPRGVALAKFDAPSEAETPRQNAEEDGGAYRWSASQFVHSVSSPEQETQPAATGERHNDTDAEHTAFEHLIRGSFAGSMSDMFSSKAVSPRKPNSDLDGVPSWLHRVPPSSEGDKQEFMRDMHGKSIASPTSLPHDDSTTTRGGASTNRNSTVSAGEEWSQDGEEYDDDEAEGHGVADIDGVLSAIDAHDNDVDHLPPVDKDRRRESHVSDFSSLMESTDHQVGGHTPTFLYDRHLAADDDEQQTPGFYGARGLSPMSADRHPRTSINTVSSAQSRDDGDAPAANATGEPTPADADASTTVDGLGIGMASPAARAPMPSFEAILDRHRIVSLAGEPMNELDENHMPSGFEVVQSPVRLTATSQSNRSMSTDGGVSEPHRSTLDANSTPTLDIQPGASGEALGEGVVRRPSHQHLRRSMGSITERKEKDGGADGRRASTSTTAVKTSLTVASPPARRGSPRPTLRTGLAIRRSMSPMNNPRQRFGALPPSPSLQNNAALSRAAASAQSYGSPPDFSHSPATMAAATQNGSPTFVAPNGPSPRRVGSPLIIDTGRAQAMQNTVPARKFMIMPPPNAADAPDVAAWHGSPPMNVQSPPTGMPAMVTPMPRKGSLGAMAATPPSPRGPRAQPFVAPPVNAMPTSAS